MKKLLAKRANKIIISLVLMVIITIGAEVLFNIHALRNAIGILDITASEDVEEINNSNRLRYSYSSEEPIYVKQIELIGKYDNQRGYIVDVTTVNRFGVEIEKRYSDAVYPDFLRAATNINEKITSIEIIIDDYDDICLDGVFLLNQFEWNKYRMLLVFLTCGAFLYCFFLERGERRVERCFLVFATIFGIMLILMTQLQGKSWDEQVHFRNVYSYAQGKNVVWTEAARDVVDRKIPNCNTKVEMVQLRRIMDQKGKNVVYTDTKNTGIMPYSAAGYLPMILLMKIGLFLKLPFSMLYLFVRCGNLLMYIVMMYLAVRMAKSRKIFLLFLGLMPTNLFLASTFTYDTAVFASMTLGTVLWFNEMRSSKQMDMKKVICAIVLFTIGCLSKAVYIPLVLLLLILPQFRSVGKNGLIIMGGIVVLFFIVAITFVLPTITNTVAGNLSYGGDLRGGDTSTVRQLISMLKHPIASIQTMIENIFHFANFRNLGSTATDNYYIVNLMFLNFAGYGILTDKWNLLIMPVLTVLLLYNENYEDDKMLTGFEKVYSGVVLLITVFLIWFSLYLSFTPVGEEMISGVQARYYLPLLYLLALVIKNKKITVSMKRDTAIGISVVTAMIVNYMLIYQYLIVSRAI